MFIVAREIIVSILMIEIARESQIDKKRENNKNK